MMIFAPSFLSSRCVEPCTVWPLTANFNIWPWSRSRGDNKITEKVMLYVCRCVMRQTQWDHSGVYISLSNQSGYLASGYLMRSMQVSTRAYRMRFDHAAVLIAYKAHVRSILEYGSVIWYGVAVTHLRRLERLQHHFFMWLGFMAQTCPPLDYDSLLELFDCESIKSRLIRRDLMFTRSIFSGHLDCTEIVGMFPLSVPSRRTRRPELFHVPRGCGRVNAVQRVFLVRVPQLLNSLTQSSPRTDVLQPSPSLISDIVRFAERQGTYIC